MPFIRGRYHLNPVMGQALEAAREAEAAMQALEHARKQQQESDDGEDSSSGNSAPARVAPGPIHRVEIEAAELVPSHSGRATRGFVARVHRHANPNSAQGDSQSAGAGAQANRYPPKPAPETHVFADHHDLANFLSDEFSKDSGE
jgi:hypothetical protein